MDYTVFTENLQPETVGYDYILVGIFLFKILPEKKTRTYEHATKFKRKQERSFLFDAQDQYFCSENERRTETVLMSKSFRYLVRWHRRRLECSKEKRAAFTSQYFLFTNICKNSHKSN